VASSHHDIFQESLGLSFLLALHGRQILAQSLAIILLSAEDSNEQGGARGGTNLKISSVL
jgi:hypothetical protein